MPCSCNNPESHIIARRQTADGVTVCLWSDGLVSFLLGRYLPGVRPSRGGWQQDADLTAGWALMGEVCCLDAAEVAPAFQALRRECRKPYQRTSWRWDPRRGGPAPGWARTIIRRALEARGSVRHTDS